MSDRCTYWKYIQLFIQIFQNLTSSLQKYSTHLHQGPINKFKRWTAKDATSQLAVGQWASETAVWGFYEETFWAPPLIVLDLCLSVTLAPRKRVPRIKQRVCKNWKGGAGEYKTLWILSPKRQKQSGPRFPQIFQYKTRRAAPFLLTANSLANLNGSESFRVSNLGLSINVIFIIMLKLVFNRLWYVTPE